MDIVILANNPLFIKDNRRLIREHAVSADLFVSIKFKYLDAVLDPGLKRHDIYFRSNRSIFFFGLDDHRALASGLGVGTHVFLMNDSDSPDNELKNEPVIEDLRRFMKLDMGLDVTLLSTGFIAILHHLLCYPDSRIVLLGFYEKGNQKVMKEGRHIRETSHHDFGCEKRILQSIADGLTYIN